MKIPKNFTDLTNRKFGKLTVISRAENYISPSGKKYSSGYNPKAKRGDCTIDRINNDGNYEPLNCRWVNMKVQSSNKRKRKKNKKPE